MSDKHMKINFWVGVYSFVILVLSALFIVFFLGKMNPFTSSITVVVLFDNVEGLKIGSNVNLEGLTIGRVVAMKLAKDTKSGRPRHEVYLKIANRPEYLRWITRESKFQIVNDNFFGDKHVEVGFSTVGKPISHLDRLEGTQTASINEILRNLQRITHSTEALIQKAASLTASFQSGKEGGLLEDLQQTISNLHFLTQKGKDLFGPKNDKTWKSLLSNLERTTQNTKIITEKINRFLQKDAKRLESSVANLQRGMQNFQQITGMIQKELGGKQGRALLHKIKKSIEDFSQTSKNLAKLTASMKKSLDTTSQQNVDLAKTMKDLQAGAENLRKITDRILSTMDAPNRFFSRIFGRKKKKNKNK